MTAAQEAEPSHRPINAKSAKSRATLPVPTAAPEGVPRLLWDWSEVTQATGIPRRTLEKELSAGRFPKPARRVGRRPYWRPADVAQWTEGKR
jgi:predicted DNA-binding transcriptional regulator AlpA